MSRFKCHGFSQIKKATTTVAFTLIQKIDTQLGGFLQCAINMLESF